MELIKKIKYSGFNDFVLLCKRLAIIFLFYQVLRIVFYLSNISHFSGVYLTGLLYMMWGGVRFDLTAIIYINSLFIFFSILPLKLRHKDFYRKGLLYLFLITNAVGYTFNILDIFYFDFILKRSTVDVFMFVSEQNMGTLLLQFVKDYWLGIVLWSILVYSTYKYYNFIKEKDTEIVTPFTYYSIGVFFMLFTVYFSIIGIRGGFTRTTRPISLNNAGAYINKPLEMAIVLNTPFSIIRTLDTKTFKAKEYYTASELKKIYTPVKNLVSDKGFTNQNVIVIIVESLAKEYVGALNSDITNYEGYTPFLDSLISKSHTYSNAFANGRKSIDALPSVIASVPSLVQPYILSSYATNKITGLGSLLKEKGYKTAFFHGSNKGSMGFDAFMKTAGYDFFYGLEDYNNDKDFDGNWGIWDEAFLQYTATTLNTFEEPFLASIFTLSSHHPFKVPKAYKNSFKKGKLPIHEPIQYTDFSLQQFFKKVSKMPWFDNTIFIITADHCNQSILPEYQTTMGAFSIPIIVYQPKKSNAAKMDYTITQQIDILPIILHKLNYSGTFISFGSNPSTEESPFAVNYINQTWHFYQGNYLLQYRDEKMIGLFLFKEDRFLKNNLLGMEETIASEMLKKLRAFIQQYYNRLIENRMTI